MKIIDTKFDFNKEITTCMLYTENGEVFSGLAHCCPEDMDVYSQKTGAEIAFRRAKSKMLRAIKRNEIMPALKALRHLSACMSKSLEFNVKSYENRMLQRQIRLMEFDLATINEMLASERQNLKSYLEGKEKINKIVRKKNEGKSN